MGLFTDNISLYGAVVGAVLLVKLAASIPVRRKNDLPHGVDPTISIAAVITVHNEDPSLLRSCLESLLGQTRLPRSVIVVDDGSSNTDAADAAYAMSAGFEQRGVEYRVIRSPDNQGKRHALAAGFRLAWDADVYLCIDSDTVLDTDAVRLAAQPLASPEVTCVTGLVLSVNRKKNVLTRLIDMRYVNAFLGERVAYSRLGSVLCACGSLALYRGPVVRRNLVDFLSQTWLGSPATSGDDRRLTYYCLMQGDAVIMPQAVAWTAVPERLSHYLKQQTRWTKSFIRESLLMVATSPRRACWWLNLVELVTWMAFTSALLVAMVVVAFHPAWFAVAVGYLGYACVMAWVRSVHYLRKAAGVPRAERWGTFAIAPLYAIMNLSLLIPLRLYALATMRNSAWGTRKEVEVTLAERGVAT